MRVAPFTSSRSRRVFARGAAALALILLAPTRSHDAVAEAARVPALPDKLTDAEFWKLVTDISEPDGYFRIVDNFTSNEREVGQIYSMLRSTKVSGDVYIGVGPEQNLTYIAAIRPKMAFIIDIRRQAVMQHLMFKAMFELGKDRAEFLTLLFGRKPAVPVGARNSMQEIWDAFATVQRDSALSAQTLVRITDRLLKTHGFKFTPEETGKFNAVFNAFQVYGPEISTQSGSGRSRAETFRTLTGFAYDNNGETQSFLSSDDNYQYVKSLHEKNLIVPVSGDFGGPKALRAIGAYVKERGAVVRAYYLSNVEQYLFQQAQNQAFYENVATLPVDSTSVFIRPYSMRRGGGNGPISSLCPIASFIRAVQAGRVLSNNDALACVAP